MSIFVVTDINFLKVGILISSKMTGIKVEKTEVIPIVKLINFWIPKFFSNFFKLISIIKM